MYQSIKSETLEKLEAAFPELRDRFGLETIGIFGSVSRGDDSEDSDINILYLFADNRGALSDFIGFQTYLELLFHRPITLLSLEFIDRDMRSSIQHDALLFGKRTEYL